MSVTIKDIARETGLSLSTISKYLNKKNIQEKNRELIESAIYRLGYQPNSIARSLRSERTMTIGIVLPDLGNYFWGDLVLGITSFFASLDYIVIECSYNYDDDQRKEVINYLVAKKVEGVIYLPTDMNDTMYGLLQDAGIAVVVMDQYPVNADKYPVDTVRSDNINSGRKLASYLISRGHRRIGIISPVAFSSTIRERIAGFQEECEKNDGISIYYPQAVSIKWVDDTLVDTGQRHLREIMKLENPPTALFCTNYVSAVGMLMEIENMNMDIPEDISVVCYDNDPLFRVLSSPLTCVAQDLKVLGGIASEILYRRIKGDWSDFPITRIEETTFKEGRSVADLTNCP